MAKMYKSKSSGSHAHVGEYMGAGHSHGDAQRYELGDMKAGPNMKFMRKATAKEFTENGKAGGKLRMQNPKDED